MPGPSPSLKEIKPSIKSPFWRRCPVTWTAVLLITLIYVLSSFPNGLRKPMPGFVELGAFYVPLVHQGEWWRYLTATLLHANPMHWFNNVAGLVIFGNFLEPVLGSSLLLALYLFAAVGGLWLSSIFLPQAVTFGASTIDFGLLGCYFTLILLVRLQTDHSAFWKELRGTLILAALFICWSLMESATINLWAHVGGLASGILFMLGLWALRSVHQELP